MSNTSVQLEGIDSVVLSYRSRGIPAFSVSQGKDLNFWYAGNDLVEGESMLSDFLEMIQQSKAVYKLRVYDKRDIKDDSIRSNTPDIGAVNFRLNCDPVGMIGSVNMGGGSNAHIRELERKLDILIQEKELRERLELESEEPDNGGISDVIGQIQQVMSIPGVSDLVGGLIRGIIAPVMQRPINGAPAVENFYNQFNSSEVDNSQNTTTDLEAAEIERAAMAFVHIRSAVPDALELFEKLAMKAQTDPDKLRSQISMVKNFL